MIPVKNVYYMLSYAFKTLYEKGYKSIETEEFQNISDLCAAILIKGIDLQVKRGLGREYLLLTESLSTPKGKIDISDSIKNLSPIKGQLVCSYDNFSVNFYMNRIIKTTLQLLLKAKVSLERKKNIKKLLVFFHEVDTLDIHSINWRFQYNRNNHNYRLLVSICNLVIKGLLQSKTDGSVKMMDFLDEQRMYHLYERFIFEYYRKEHPEIGVHSSQIKWQEDNGFMDLLPIMQSDIMLECGKSTLIIDAKYYTHTMQKQSQFTNMTFYSHNLYQIFTYVKNKEAELSNKPHEKVSGMLLYAQTDTEGIFEKEYKMSGNPIIVRTLDLSRDFATIKAQLDDILTKYLKVNVA